LSETVDTERWFTETVRVPAHRMIGPATEKARRPRVLSRWRGTVRWCRLELESRALCRWLAMSETGVQQLARYMGPCHADIGALLLRACNLFI